MSSSLVSLPNDIFYDISQHLSTTDLHKLMQCSKKLYINGKHDFDKRCFRLLPVSLSKESLQQAEDLLSDEFCEFVEAILIRIDRAHNAYDSWDNGWKQAKYHLTSVLLKIFQASTGCHTIIVRDYPEKSARRSSPAIKAVAKSIEMAASSLEPTRQFKVQLQKLRLNNSKSLRKGGEGLFHRIQSIDIKIYGDEKQHHIGEMEEVLSDAENLEELSLINDTERLVSGSIVSQLLGNINSTIVRSLTITGIEISSGTMKRILFPFRHSLQELNIKRISLWGSSFSSFLNYFIKHPVNSLSFEDIWVTGLGESHKVNNPMKIYREVMSVIDEE
jgi:hypothetical protein